ncbi:hypothetical protein FGA82_21135 [Pseudomonas fluorescens]|uniref:hypothetical protein n=1 Tax=Pseudomonas fluorescens TaxID=294 RepID=UPI0011311553|nr:hypothetical protein [Pseudomonas fluorescens]TMU74956.1 hypothetical protein FGA82_21135 [Pseudomonas fluorescens]
MNIGDFVDLQGWLVIIDYRLFLIPENYSENYEEGDRYEISKPEIIFAVAELILPLAGGKSFIFHKSKLSGVVVGSSPIRIDPVTLSVEERGRGFLSINVANDSLDKYREQYKTFLEKGRSVNSDDWLDYF